MERMFANTIRFFRKWAKLTQEKVAERAGITQSQVSRLEDGASWPHPETLDRLCKAFGVSNWEFCMCMAVILLTTPKGNWMELSE